MTGKTFNPDRAQPVEDDIFDQLMERMSTSRQLQQVTDSLRVVLQLIREDSSQNQVQMIKTVQEALDGHKESHNKFMDEYRESIKGLLEKYQKACCSEISSSHASQTKRQEIAQVSLKRVEDLVRELSSRPEPKQERDPEIAAIRLELAELRGQLGRAPNMDEKFQQLRELMSQKPSYVFQIERDEYGRATTIRATA